METTNERVANQAVQGKTPARELRRLQIFVGRWKVLGKNFPAAPGAAGMMVQGEDNYAWMNGNYFVVGSWQHLFLGGGHIGLSVMGFDEQKKRLFTRNFDNQGYERTYFFEIEGNTWKYLGDQERATRIYMHEGRTFEEHWEMKDQNGQWIPLCDMNGTKI